MSFQRWAQVPILRLETRVNERTHRISTYLTWGLLQPAALFFLFTINYTHYTFSMKMWLSYKLLSYFCTVFPVYHKDLPIEAHLRCHSTLMLNSKWLKPSKYRLLIMSLSVHVQAIEKIRTVTETEISL